VPITELDMDTTLETTKTFRGRTLDELLPQIRAELGPDAVVLRRREGLAGGIGGFFQRSYVEVEARAAQPDDDDPTLEARNDRATAEGLASPAIQALVEQAAPFAAALSRAETAHDVLADTADADAGLYGPQPNRAAIEAAAHDFIELAVPAEDEPAPELVVPDAPRAARAAEERLVAAGLSSALARDVVAEAVAHGLPFAQPRGLKKLIRTALARRMPVMGDLGGGPRTLAFVGPGGAGKSAAVEQLAAAYARAGTDVAVVALDGREDAAQVARRLKRRRPGLTIVDAPAAGPADPATTARLADELRTLDVDEVHLALPATTGAAAAAELSRALAPLGITHIALTHADQTAHPGAAVELATTSRRALSYVCTRETIAPADPDALAKQLLP
jgi:flagellar biosynthesis GTPase FlhF